MTEIVYAAFAALVITWIVELFLKGFRRMIMRTTIIEFDPEDYTYVIAKCFGLFPKPNIVFKGVKYCRGTRIRIVTREQKTYEGDLIGQNYDNMICLLTSDHVITYDLSSIEEMKVV